MNERHSRQSFLGPSSEQIITQAVVGVVGLGGGGSHIVQQLAHIGFRRFALFDQDVVEDSNLNRLVSATLADVAAGRMKLRIAIRTIGRLCRRAKIAAVVARWQTSPHVLALCDIVFGSVDGLQERNELEAFCRRQLIPYVDIGMDVFERDGEPPRMAGQVILSMPGGPCMWCLRFLTEQNLAQEAAKYGAAGPRPQVVWPNGVLASSAVGIAMDVLTGWTQLEAETCYRIYDGNSGILRNHPIVSTIGGLICPHYPLAEAGSPVLRSL